MPNPVSTILLLVLSAATAAGQTVHRFDMGPASSPLAAGFTAVDRTTAYSAARGHGWTQAPTSEALRPAPAPQVRHALPENLIRDLVLGTADCTFRVDLPAGRYLCLAYLGDLGNPNQALRPLLTPREKLDIKVGATTVVQGAYARLASRKAKFDEEAWGGYKRVRFLADAAGGRLELTFHCTGTRPDANAIMGLEIYPWQEAPIRFDHQAGGLVAGAGFQQALGPALQAFNTHDYAKTKTLLDQVKDPLARAWGYAWWNGWLKGLEEDMDLELLALTRQLLEGLKTPDDPRAAVLLQDVKDMELGLRCNFLRGYSRANFADSLENIVQNLSAAVQLFEQMEDDLLGAADPHRPECPFHPKARFLLARNMYSRYTGVGDPRQPWAAFWLGVFRDEFAPNLKLFPRAQNAALFAFFARNYGVNGGLHNWTPATLPTYDPTQAWWAKYTEHPDHPAAPRWANAMRAYYRSFRGAGTWWMERRLFGGELGGGGGDDVEGAGLLSFPTICLTEPGASLELGVRDCMEKVLFGRELDQDQGYFANCADVEHAAEYSAYPLFALLPVFFGDPAYVSFAIRSIRNMDEKADPQPWTVPFAPGLRHFRSYKFGAKSVCGPGRDIPCCLRAAIPGFFLLDYNNLPRVEQLFDELSRAWAADAMSTAQGKPKGIPPASVTPTTNPVFGTGGSWWLNGGYYDLPKGTAYYGYLYSLFLSAYNRSTAKDRHIHLEPILHSGYLVEDLIMGRLTGTGAGQPQWTADTLKGPIAGALAQAYPALAADPALKLGPADLQRLQRVIDTYAPAYLKYIRQAGTGPKNKKVLEDAFEGGRQWLRWFFPMGTSSVTYTDRCFVMWGGSHHLIYSAMLGGAFDVNPTYVISWVNPAPAAGPLDAALLVNDFGPDRLDLLLFNYEGRARDMAFRLWRQLEFGKYTVRVGDDRNFDDRIDGTPHTSFPITYDSRGATVTLPKVPAGVLQKVELRRTAPISGTAALLPDLAVSAGEVELRPGGKVAVRVHNLGGADLPGGTLELREGAVKLGSAPIPAIPSTLDLTPKSVLLTLPYAPLSPAAALTVEVRPAASVKREVTGFNNRVTVKLPLAEPLLGITPRAGFGTFDVTLESPHDPGRIYLIAAGLSGTSPGLPLGPGVTLPLNWDFFTDLSFQLMGSAFTWPVGLLDGRGRTVMRVFLPVPSLKGLRIDFAGLVLNQAWGVRAVSGAEGIRL